MLKNKRIRSFKLCNCHLMDFGSLQGYVEADNGNGWIKKPKDSTTGDVEEKQMTPFEEMLAKMDELMRVHKEDCNELKECLKTISKKLDAKGAPDLDDI
ncbi:hypothetical protein GYH30_022633 [Glycine max]|nr:hypothetical protein GYH30_022633 [Glycine max]